MYSTTDQKSRALKMVGLPTSEPIRSDELADRIAKAGRVADFLSLIERPIPDDVIEKLQKAHCHVGVNLSVPQAESIGRRFIASEFLKKI